MDHGFLSMQCNNTDSESSTTFHSSEMWRQKKTAYQRLLSVMLVLGITVYKGDKRVRKNCITRLHVEMAHYTPIFIPLHANSKVKFILYLTINAQKQRYIFTLSLTLALDGGGWSTPHPSWFTRGKETWYSMYRRLGGRQVKSTRMHKISLPPGFDPRAVQHVENRYTDCAIPAHHAISYWRKPVMVWVHGNVWLFLCILKAGSYHLKYWWTTAHVYFTGWEILN
jgi:hypothetical protein